MFVESCCINDRIIHIKGCYIMEAAVYENYYMHEGSYNNENENETKHRKRLRKSVRLHIVHVPAGENRLFTRKSISRYL